MDPIFQLVKMALKVLKQIDEALKLGINQINCAIIVVLRPEKPVTLFVKS